MLSRQSQDDNKNGEQKEGKKKKMLGLLNEIIWYMFIFYYIFIDIKQSNHK